MALLTYALPADAATLVVPTDFPTIQAGIDAAVAGDIVLVEPGTYTENLSLRSDISVIGREAARTTIQPANSLLASIAITDSVNIRLSNLTLDRASTGISVTFSSDVLLSNLIVTGASELGIDIDDLSAADVQNSVFFENDVAVRRGSINVNVSNSIFRNNVVTITSPFQLINNNTNVDANCWSGNADLLIGDLDGSYGTDAVIGNPFFVDTGAGDFHLREASPCIDIGIGIDVIDDTRADAGAYGGPLADALPFPVGGLSLTEAGNLTSNIDASWDPNESYLITSSTSPGGYRLYYRQNAAGPPYDATDGDGGLAPSPIDVGDRTAFRLNNLSPEPPLPSTPTLLSAAGVNRGVALTWEPVADANGYRIHYGIESTAENEIDVGDVTSATVSGLTNGTQYRFALSALGRATYHVAVTAVDNTDDENESEFSAESLLAIGPELEGALSNELMALPELILAYPLLADEGGCFIATAAFGSDWAREVELLRDFRDRYLLTTAAGRWFVRLYYRWSPPIADAIRDRPLVRSLVRFALMPFVFFAWLLLEAPAVLKLSAGALAFGLVGWLAHRRRRARMASEVTLP